MRIKKMIVVAGLALAFLAMIISVVSAAEITTNGTEVHIKPSAARGESIISGMRGASLIGDVLDILTYLIYVAAVVDILYCTLIVLVSVAGGKKINSLKSIKDEIDAKDGVWKVTKTIFFMVVGITALDYLYYYT